MADELMTVRDVANVCHRSEETVRRWIWSGKLSATKLGNQLFVKRSDIEAMSAPRLGELKELYGAARERPPLFEQYGYSPLEEMMTERHGGYLPTDEQEAEYITEDEAFREGISAKFGPADVLALLARDQ
jgi:excisionase family DNA binding protein